MAGRTFTGRLRWQLREGNPTNISGTMIWLSARTHSVLQQESLSINGGDQQWHDVPTDRSLVDPPKED
jgi:hypothetical protein